MLTRISRPLRTLHHLIKKREDIDELTADGLSDMDFEEWIKSGFPRNALCWESLVFTPSSLSNRVVSNRLTLARLCIPSSVEFFGNRMFRGSTTLELLVFEMGSRLTSIPSHCFGRCSMLFHVVRH
jgi:hypothetical protein